MAQFPKLKTAAVAQYPAVKKVSYGHRTVRFVDGREQRYRETGSARREWTIELDLLDEGETAALVEFFREVEGRAASFAFTDPWDGVEYASCRLGDDAIEITSSSEMRGSTRVRIVENQEG